MRLTPSGRRQRQVTRRWFPSRRPRHFGLHLHSLAYGGHSTSRLTKPRGALLDLNCRREPISADGFWDDPSRRKVSVGLERDWRYNRVPDRRELIRLFNRRLDSTLSAGLRRAAPVILRVSLNQVGGYIKTLPAMPMFETSLYRFPLSI
jgi:hypothetical protein